MSLRTHARAMARNNAWSNHRLLAACARLAPGEFEAPRTAFFPSLQLTLHHVLVVDGYYLDALEGVPGALGRLTESDARPCATVAELQAAQAESDRRLVRYCDVLDAQRLASMVAIEREGGRWDRERVDRVLSHLFAHQIHHRGQAHAMLSGTGVAPPQLDEFLLAADAPLRAAEMAALGWDESATWAQPEPELDHLILAVNDRRESVDFYTRILGFGHEGERGPFSVIRVSDGLTLQLAPWTTAGGEHLAFALGRAAFDEVFRRVREAGVEYGDSFQTVGNRRGPGDEDGARGPGKALYVFDPNKHLIEIRYYDA